MGRRPHHHGRRNHKRAAAPPPPALRTAEMFEKKEPVVYGDPFIVLEDAEKQTFVFSGGRWQPHSATIAECRVDCEVKQLPQKINGMTRYEIREPV